MKSFMGKVDKMFYYDNLQSFTVEKLHFFSKKIVKIHRQGANYNAKDSILITVTYVTRMEMRVCSKIREKINGKKASY